MDVNPEAPPREPACRLAFGAAVLAPPLLLVAEELFVELGMGQDIVPRPRLLVGRQEVLIMVDPDEAVLDLEHDPQARHAIRDDVAVGVERDLAVPVDLPEDLERGVVVRGRQRAQMWALLPQALVYSLMSRAVDAAVNRLGEPDAHVFVRLPDRCEPVAPPEAFADVIDRPLRLALGPGIVGWAEPGLEAVVVGEMQKLRVPDGLAGLVAADDDELHVVVEDLGRHAPERVEGAHLFFQLVSRRYEKGVLILTSNRSFSQWNEIFGDPVIATAILDRILHHSTTINIKGNSYRLREKVKAGLIREPEVEDNP